MLISFDMGIYAIMLVKTKFILYNNTNVHIYLGLFWPKNMMRETWPKLVRFDYHLGNFKEIFGQN